MLKITSDKDDQGETVVTVEVKPSFIAIVAVVVFTIWMVMR